MPIVQKENVWRYKNKRKSQFYTRMKRIADIKSEREREKEKALYSRLRMLDRVRQNRTNVSHPRRHTFTIQYTLPLPLFSYKLNTFVFKTLMFIYTKKKKTTFRNSLINTTLIINYK